MKGKIKSWRFSTYARSPEVARFTCFNGASQPFSFRDFISRFFCEDVISKSNNVRFTDKPSIVLRIRILASADLPLIWRIIWQKKVKKIENLRIFHVKSTIKTTFCKTTANCEFLNFSREIKVRDQNCKTTNF